MHFSHHPPPPALAGAVKAIWCARGTKAEFDTPDPIVPDGCVEIIFNLGDRFIDHATAALQPRALLAGQMTGPVTAAPTGGVDLLGIRFRTGRAGVALRTPMWELQDRLIDAAGVLPAIDRLAEVLRDADPADRLKMLTRSLSGRWREAGPMSAIDEALALIDAHRGTLPIAIIARRVGITRRHLERRFRDHVGLGVKQLSRITRIHAVLRALRDRPAATGAEIAAAFGYTDQAHLIRECKALTGRTPARLTTPGRSLSGLMRAEA